MGTGYVSFGIGSSLSMPISDIAYLAASSATGSAVAATVVDGWCDSYLAPVGDKASQDITVRPGKGEKRHYVGRCGGGAAEAVLIRSVEGATHASPPRWATRPARASRCVLVS